MIRRGWLCCAGLPLALPGVACAHSPVPGLGRFYNGMLHPVLAPAPLIALLALGLLIGQRGLGANPRAVLAFALGLGLGLAAAARFAGPPIEIGLLAGGVVTAGVTLAMLELSPAALALLAAVLGAAAGFGLADPTGGDGRWLILTGSWLGAALCTLGTAALAELATRPWQRVAVRVVASWLAASAILVLTLAWLGPKPEPGRSAAPWPVPAALLDPPSRRIPCTGYARRGSNSNGSLSFTSVSCASRGCMALMSRLHSAGST